MARNPATTPLDIAPTEDASRLRIRWRDGHTSELEPRQLRLACRCAGCVEEMSDRPLLDPTTVPAAVHPLAIHYVGRYALRFDWSDGHRTGIYPFDLLRRLCPCAQCSQSTSGAACG
jgi:ATP-binding protein involved in chromosome partitioning